MALRRPEEKGRHGRIASATLRTCSRGAAIRSGNWGFHAELNRQREFYAGRLKAIQDRSAVYVGAAIVCVLIVRSARGPELNTAKLRDNLLPAHLYSAEYALVSDKLAVHLFDVGTLTGKVTN